MSDYTTNFQHGQENALLRIEIRRLKRELKKYERKPFRIVEASKAFFRVLRERKQSS